MATKKKSTKKAAAPPSTGWSTSTWKGRPNYQCDRCTFSTLQLPEMQEHITKEHKGAPAVAAR